MFPFFSCFSFPDSIRHLAVAIEDVVVVIVHVEVVGEVESVLVPADEEALDERAGARDRERLKVVEVADGAVVLSSLHCSLFGAKL